MRLGTSYMGHHNPKHLAADMKEMQALGLDDVFLAAQENDSHYFWATASGSSDGWPGEFGSWPKATFPIGRLEARRDRRLPMPSAVLKRAFKGQEHQVIILPGGSVRDYFVQNCHLSKLGLLVD
jgi:hypothetical protein